MKEYQCVKSHTTSVVEPFYNGTGSKTWTFRGEGEARREVEHRQRQAGLNQQQPEMRQRRACGKYDSVKSTTGV